MRDERDVSEVVDETRRHWLRLLLAASAEHAAKGDRWFLVRQLGQAQRERESCESRTCSSESPCAGCRGLIWLLARLEDETAPLFAEDSWRCGLELDKGRGKSERPGEQQSLIPGGAA